MQFPYLSAQKSMSPPKHSHSLAGWENREGGQIWTQLSKFSCFLCCFQPHKPLPCCHLGIRIQDYSVWSAWRQTCLLCCHAKMKSWIPFCCPTVLWYFYYPRALFFSIWLHQGIKLWTFIAPTFAFFSHVECKQQSDAVLARKWGQAFLDLLMFIMKRLRECITKLSFPLTQPYWPSGTIHASEETDDILEKLIWPNL